MSDFEPKKCENVQQKRGLALVITINKYHPNIFNLTERSGQNKDVDNLIKSLKNLEFEIDLAENLTKLQLERHLQDKASISFHDFEYFLCVVISHDHEGNAIVTSDSQLVKFEQIMDPFRSCSSLMNKSKILIIQGYRLADEIGSSSNMFRRQSSILFSRANSMVSVISEVGSQIIDRSGNSSFSDEFLQTISKNVSTIYQHSFELVVFYSTLFSHLELCKIVEFYFLAKSVIKLQNNEETNRIFKESKYLVVRKFLNDMIKPFDMVKPQQQKRIKIYLKDEIENCCKENLANLLDYLISVRYADVKSRNKFLILASQYGHEKIVQLLIEAGIDMNQKDEN